MNKTDFKSLIASVSLAFVASGVLLFGSTGPALAQSKTPIFLGKYSLPTGFKINGIEFGGISGLDYDPAQDIFYAISDDRSEFAPARFYKLKLDINAAGINGLDIIETVELRNAEGKTFAVRDSDPEAIRYSHSSKTLFWSSERDLAGNPSVREMNLDGRLIREFKVPSAYLPNTEKTRGARDNYGFESLTLSADEKFVIAAMENAVIQDGELSSINKGSKSRVIVFDKISGDVSAEYIYETEPLFAKATREPFWNDSGVNEILADGDDLLVVERSNASGVGYRISIYRASFAGATNIKGKASIKNTKVTPLKKELLLRLNEGDYGLTLDNFEAITFGPEVDGAKTLVLASDNNFYPDQVSKFLVFKLP